MNHRLARLLLLVIVPVWIWNEAIAEELPVAPAAALDHPFFKKPILLGIHRGGAGEWPENTMIAFTEAAKRWPEALLETDARLSADGVPVLIHDATVDRTTDGTGPVSGMTREALQRLDAAYRFKAEDGNVYPFRSQGIAVPTLESVLLALPTRRFLVELKDSEGIADAVAEVLLRLEASERVLVASFNPSVIERFRALAPQAPTCYDMKSALELMSALRGGDWEAYRPALPVLSVSLELERRFKITEEETQAIRAKGILYQVHTLNDLATLEHRLGRVDSILTDRPSALASIMPEGEVPKP